MFDKEGEFSAGCSPLVFFFQVFEFFAKGYKLSGKHASSNHFPGRHQDLRLQVKRAAFELSCNLAGAVGIQVGKVVGKALLTPLSHSAVTWDVLLHYILHSHAHTCRAKLQCPRTEASDVKTPGFEFRIKKILESRTCIVGQNCHLAGYLAMLWFRAVWTDSSR